MKGNRLLSFAVVALMLLLLGQSARAGTVSGGKQTPSDTQDFQDVPTSYLFYQLIHNLYVDGIISGFTCGQPPAGPCGNPPLPYYLPGANVTRAQMSKYADLSRRNIADATGRTLTITSTNGTSGAPFTFQATMNSAGGADAWAGFFNNTGGGAAGQRGLEVHNKSTGGTTGWGEYINNFGGGTGDQIGLEVHNNSTGGHNGNGAFFSNTGTGSGFQFGVDAYTDNGWGVHGISSGSNANQGSDGVVGESSAQDTNNDHEGVLGIAQSATGSSHAAYGVFGQAPFAAFCQCAGGSFRGWSGVIAGGGGAPGFFSDDGLEAAGNGGSSFAIYSTQPTGDSNFTLVGEAHIHGSNIAGASYEVEVRYHGSQPAQIGDVLVADGNNETVEGTSVLGVVKADSSNADAAIGVVAYRLDTSKVNGMDKTYIDKGATQIKPGDRAYVVVVGQARMKISGSAHIGSHINLGSSGPAVATSGAVSNDLYIGKVVSAPDQNGYVTVFVNLK